MPLDFESVREVCLSMPGATEQIQWGADLVFKVGGKMFAVMGTQAAAPEGPHANVMSLKTSDDDFDRLTAREGIIPAPYLARAKWIAIERYDVLSGQELDTLVRSAYALVAAKLPTRVRASLASTPGGATELAAPSMSERAKRSNARGKRKRATGATARPRATARAPKRAVTPKKAARKPR